MSKIKFLIVALVAMAFSVGLLVYAQSTNNTLTGTAGNTKDTTNWEWVWSKSSTIPVENSRRGILVRAWDFDVQGGAVGTYDLGDDLPDNILITDGYIQVIEAVLPTTSTNALHVNAAEDVYAPANLTAGLKDVVPASSAASAVLTSGTTSNLIFTITGSAATQGMFVVYLDCIRAQ